jgi:hypothetical protein
MKTFNHGKGMYGYTYIQLIEIPGKGVVKERHNFKFESYVRRDAAFEMAKQTIKNGEGWRKTG